MYQNHCLGFYEITFHKTTGVHTKEKVKVTMEKKNDVKQLYFICCIEKLSNFLCKLCLIKQHFFFYEVELQFINIKSHTFCWLIRMTLHTQITCFASSCIFKLVYICLICLPLITNCCQIQPSANFHQKR